MKLIALPVLLGVWAATATPAPDHKPKHADDAPTAREQAALDKALAGYVAGAPQSCMPLARDYNSQIYPPDTILYSTTSAQLWRAEVSPCPALRRDVILVQDVHGGQLCRLDRVRTIDRGSNIPSAWCHFTGFTPYSRVKK